MAICCAAPAQEIAIYSEFERFDPAGQPVPQDRDFHIRELLSPAVPRNGHLSVHVVVTAPVGSNYFLYINSNPPGILDMKMYREHFVACGAAECPDWLTEQRMPAFGAMPESLRERPLQTARTYLLDIYVPADVPPRRVRVEALLKTGIWQVAPLELRVIAPLVPDSAWCVQRRNVAPAEHPSSETAQRQLLGLGVGLAPEFPPGILTVRDVLQRNAAEDMLLARAAGLPGIQLNLLALSPLIYPPTGAEWYLRARDFIYRYAR